MAEFDLYIDCDQKKSVAGDTNNTPKPIPAFFQGDTVFFRVYLLKPAGGFSEYSILPTSGLTLQMALGDLAGETICSAQYTWTEVDGEYFEASLPMNTAEIDTLLGADTSADVQFEVKYLREGVPTTVLQETVKLRKSLINPASVMPVPTPTPLSAEAAIAMFVRLIETRPVYLEGSDGSLIKLWNDDGTFKADNEA